MGNLKAYFAVLCASITVLIGCGENGVAKRSDNAPRISGKLLQSDNTSPARGAVVTLEPRSAIASIAGHSVAKRAVNKQVAIVGDDGGFRIDSCAAGVYVIEGVDEKGNGVRIDSVIVSDEKQMTEVPTHSLKSLSAVRGIVKLNAGGDASNVFVLAFGSDRFVQTNSDGAFFMGDLPYGEYELKIVCVLQEYGGCKTVSVTALSGDTVDTDTIMLETQELCIPQNVTYAYDSLKHCIRLKWDSCTGNNIKGYNVYRMHRGEEQYGKSPLNTECITDGVSFDDLTIAPSWPGQPDTFWYTFGIAAVSNDGVVGRKSLPLLVKVVRDFFYQLNTIVGPDGFKPLHVVWEQDTMLMVTYVNAGSISIVTYGKNFSVLDSSGYTLPMAKIAGVKIENDNIYVHDDSTLYGFTQTGQMRFACNIHCFIWQFDAFHDTLFAFVIARDSAGKQFSPTYVYDTAGKILNKLNDSNTVVFFKQASNGAFFTMKWGDDGYWELRKHNSLTSSGILCASRKGVGSEFVDACNDKYMLQSNYEFQIYSFDGNLYSRIPCSRNQFTYKSGALNSRGQVAFCNWDGYVLVVALPDSDSPY